MPWPIPTAEIERNLSLASAVGAIAGWTFRPGRRRGARRWEIALPTGDTLVYGPVGTHAFGLGVRMTVEAMS